MSPGDSSNWNRRRFVRTAGAAGVVGLAGCSGGGGGNGTGGGGGGGSGGATTGGQLSGTIKIGTVGPMNARSGNDNRAAALMVAEELNDDGGLLGADVEVISKDNQENDPGIAKQRYQELILQDEVDMVNGGWFGASVEQMLTVEPDVNTPHFYPGSAMPMADRLREDFENYRNTFRIGEDIRQAAYNRAEQLRTTFSELGINNIAFLFEDLGYNVGMEPILTEELGGDFDIRVNQRFPANTDDFTSLFDNLESNNVRGLWIEAFLTGTQAVLQWGEQERDFVMLGSIGSLQSPTGWQNSNGAAEYAGGNSFTIPGAPRNDLTTPFVTAFKERTGNYPAYTGSITYPTVKAFAEAVRQAGSRDPDDVINALEELTMETTLGTLDIQGQDGEFPHHAVQDRDHIYQQGFQWQAKDGEGIDEDEFYPNSNGVQECIWPESDRTQAPVKPSWATF